MFEARKISEECPFWERHVTLGRVKDGSVSYAQNKTEKYKAILDATGEINEGVTFFVAWTGQWKTDIFAVTEDDIVDFIGSR